MTIQVGVIGLGIGQKHLASLAQIPDVRIVAVADLVESHLLSIASLYNTHHYMHWQCLLDQELALDAVVLATPSHVRIEPIKAICERKLALFCEKPPAVCLDTAHQIAKLLTQAGIINAVGFQYRYSLFAERLSQLLRERGAHFARILVATGWPTFNWMPTPPQHLYKKAASGGPLIEHGIHFQDVLRYITNAEPVSVQAMAELGTLQPVEGRDTEETTLLLARYSSGLLATQVHCWSHVGDVSQLQVVGYDFDLTWHFADIHHLVGMIDQQTINECDRTNPYLEEMKTFIAAVQQHNQRLIRSSYIDACQSMAVCQAATEAIDNSIAHTVVASFLL